MTTFLKKSNKRTESSRRWLTRQLNDPYVQAAQAQGYRSRAAFKLLELDDRFHFFRKGQVVVDLGAAPGGWSQVAIQRVGFSDRTKTDPGAGAGSATGGEDTATTRPEVTQTPRVVGIDLLPITPMQGALFIEGDFLQETMLHQLEATLQPLGGRADVVVCDMAPSTCGHQATDHLRIMGMLEEAWDFTERILKPGGTFVAKTFQGGTEQDLLVRLKAAFHKIAHAKPPASRKASSELYFVAMGFRGPDAPKPSHKGRG